MQLLIIWSVLYILFRSSAGEDSSVILSPNKLKERMNVSCGGEDDNEIDNKSDDVS